MTEVNHANDATTPAATQPVDIAPRLQADATPAPGSAVTAGDTKQSAPLAIDNGKVPEIVGATQSADLYKGTRNGDGAVSAPAKDPVAAFGKLELTNNGNASDQPLSPVMTEARRVEDSYRGRYAANDEAMKAVGTVMGANNPDINGTMTRDSLDKAITNAQSADQTDPRYGKEFQEGAQYLKNNWNDMSISPYKAVDGSINPKSAQDGHQRMIGEQDQIAKQILSTEMNAVALDKSKAPTGASRSLEASAAAPPVEAKSAVDVKDAIVKQGQTRHGEGPYQVAARVLGSDGKAPNDKQLKELTDAFKQTYEEERKANPKMHDLHGLKIGHEFITKENINNVLGKITDPALKDRLTKIVGQETAFKPPVISAIPHRTAPAHDAHPTHQYRPTPHVVPVPVTRPRY